MPPKGSDDASGKLRPKQRIFVQEYCATLNATQAAIRAGYSPKTAYAIGAENLRKPEIAVAIERAQNRALEKAEVTTDQIVAEFAAYAFRQRKNSHGAITDASQAIKALDKLARIKGLYNDASAGAGASEPNREPVSHRISTALERIRSG